MPPRQVFGWRGAQHHVSGRERWASDLCPASCAGRPQRERTGLSVWRRGRHNPSSVTGQRFPDHSLTHPSPDFFRRIGEFPIGPKSVPNRFRKSVRDRFQIGSKSVPNRFRIGSKSVPHRFQVRNLPGTSWEPLLEPSLLPWNFQQPVDQGCSSQAASRLTGRATAPLHNSLGRTCACARRALQFAR